MTRAPTLAHTTRIAPSPTGMMHLGTMRTAVFNWLAARANGGRFILRIDDTDIARNQDAAVGVIDDAMTWMGLDHDLRFCQSSRLDLYASLAHAMVQAGLAVRDGDAIRLVLPDPMPTHWVDSLSGPIAITTRDHGAIGGLVLLRSNGQPTYHFASVVDDMDKGVTWVIRGIDHISNTAKQVAVWTALGGLDWRGAHQPMPTWTHVGLITHMGRKLSKRDGNASVLAYRDGGVDPDALFNYVLRLGWGPTVDDRSTRTISRARALELFVDGGRMKSSPANMDPRMLDSLNRKYSAARERAERILVPPQ